MSGPLTVPLAIAAFYVETKVLKTLYGALAVLCFSLCAYWLWRNQRLAVIATQNEVRERIAKLEAQLSEHNRDSLIFDVDTNRQSHANILCNLYPVTRGSAIRKPKVDYYTLELNFRLRFENHNVNPIAIKKVDVTIISIEDGKEKEVPLLRPLRIDVSQEDTEEKIKLDEVEIGGGRFTPYYRLKCGLDLVPEYGESLSHNHFLRVTMDAMRQPLYSQDFNVTWEIARFSKYHITRRKY